MNNEEFLYNKIYERTKDFGRSQFIKEIMRLERENKQDNLINYLEDMISIRESYLGVDSANFDTTLEDEIDVIKDILERVKSGKYE